MTLTISRRIGLLALCGAAAVLGVSGLAAVQMQAIFDTTNFANVNTIPSLDTLNDIDGSISEIGLSLWQHVTTGDDGEHARLQRAIDDDIARVRASFDKYEREDMDEPPEVYAKDKAQLDAERATLDEVAAQRDQVIGYSVRGERGEARTQLLAAQQILRKLGGLVHDHQQFNIGLGKAAATDAKQAKRAAIGIFAATAAVTLVLLGALGIRSRQAVAAPLRRAVGAAQRASAGDFRQAIAADTKDEPGQVLAAMEQMRASVVDTVRRIQESADAVASASRDIAHGTNDLGSRTEMQASSIQQTAATIEQISAAVRNNSENADRAKELAARAREVSREGGQAVHAVVDTMHRINDSSRRIADIISVMDAIAFQTNILALNASVEAARAGEQGRGFAVVASEVRNLAQRSAAASREIKSVISLSIERVDQGTSLVDHAGKKMQTLLDSVDEVAQIIADISQSGREQSDGVAQIGHTISQIEHATQQNSALVEQSAAAAESLRDQAHAMHQAVAVFQV
jgi:methyl-accepting chemotaxis protein